VLPTSDVGGVDAAVYHVLWCLVLQTSVDCCTQLVHRTRDFMTICYINSLWHWHWS